MAPWNGPAPDSSWDVLQADGVLQFYPWRDMVFESWGKGQIPSWNPYELAGAPLLANSQSAALYPPHILVGVLHIPTGVAMVLLAWFHLLWAGLGVYYLSRRLGGSRNGSLIAGSAFCLSAFMVAWTVLPSVITTVSWIPWILGLIVGVFSGPKRRHKIILLAVCVAMMFLGGHLQFAAYGMMAAVVMTLWITISTWNPTRARTGFYAFGVLIGLFLGGLLAAPQLLPVINYSKFSHRANVPDQKGYEGYTKTAIPGFALQSLAFPTALGNPAKPSPVEKGLNGDWAALASNNADFAETALGLGPVVFILLFFMKKPRGGTAALVLIGILALLLGLGTVLNEPLYFLVPGWSASGSPGRAVVLFVMAACVLAGVVSDNVIEGQPKKVYGIAAGVCVFGFVLAAVPILFGPAYSTSDQLNSAIKTYVSSEAPVFLATAIIALIAVCAARYKPEYRRLMPIGVVLCSVFAYGWNLIPTSSSTLANIKSDGNARYAFVNASWGLLAPTPNLMPPNTASYSHIHDLAGYDSLLHRDSVLMLQAIDQGTPTPPANGNMMLVKPKADPKLLEEAGVTHVWSQKPIPSFTDPQGTVKGPYMIPSLGIVEYELLGPGRAYTPNAPAQIVSESYNDIVIKAQGPGPLTLKDRMMPGWTATVDDKPAEITPLDSSLGKDLWRQVNLEGGGHTIHMTCQPPGLITGIICFLVSALLCIGLLLLPVVKIVTSEDGLPLNELENSTPTGKIS